MFSFQRKLKVCANNMPKLPQRILEAFL
jgi:hypothetical protein